MKNFFKTVLYGISTILIFILSCWIVNIIIQHIVSDIKIENFKKKCIFDEAASTSTMKIYKMESDEEAGYTIYNNNFYPGRKSDVLVSRKSDIGVPVAEELTTFFVGGHAGIVVDDYQDYNVHSQKSFSVEATGMYEGINPSINANRYYWNNRDETIVVRANSITEAEKDEVMSNTFALLGDPYNYSFTFQTDRKSYCSDIVPKVFESIGINFNKNGYWTTIYDIIVSNDCHVVYYHYIKDGIKYIYYIE